MRDADWFGWIAASGLCPYLAMTTVGSGGRGSSSQFSDASPKAVIASPLGCGNPVSSLFVIARKVSKRTGLAIQSGA